MAEKNGLENLAEKEAILKEVEKEYNEGKTLEGIENLKEKYSSEIKLIEKIYFDFCVADVAKNFNMDEKNMKSIFNSYKSGMDVVEACEKYDMNETRLRSIYQEFFKKVGLLEKN